MRTLTEICTNAVSSDASELLREQQVLVFGAGVLVGVLGCELAVVRGRDLGGVAGVLGGVWLSRQVAGVLVGARRCSGLGVVAARRAVSSLALRVQVLAWASVVREEDALVLLRLVLS